VRPLLWSLLLLLLVALLGLRSSTTLVPRQGISVLFLLLGGSLLLLVLLSLGLLLGLLLGLFWGLDQQCDCFAPLLDLLHRSGRFPLLGLAYLGPRCMSALFRPLTVKALLLIPAFALLNLLSHEYYEERNFRDKQGGKFGFQAFKVYNAAALA